MYGALNRVGERAEAPTHKEEACAQNVALNPQLLSPACIDLVGLGHVVGLFVSLDMHSLPVVDVLSS